MKAEHYIKSSLNGIPTSVAKIETCIMHAANPEILQSESHSSKKPTTREQPSSELLNTGACELKGIGLPSQNEWIIEGEALVTNRPITFLGYVNRITGVIEEEGHPLDGRSISGKILIFPRGSGSSVAPYVLMGLIYRGKGPLAVINTQVDQQTIPACSLLEVPYAYGFDDDPCLIINNGDNILSILLKLSNLSNVKYFTG